MAIPLDRALEYRQTKFIPSEIRVLLFTVSSFTITQEDTQNIAHAMFLKSLKEAQLAVREKLVAEKTDKEVIRSREEKIKQEFMGRMD